MDRKRKYCYGNKRGIKLLKTDGPKCRRYKRTHQHEPCLTLITNYAQQTIKQFQLFGRVQCLVAHRKDSRGDITCI